MGVFHLSAASSDLYAHLITDVISAGNVLLTVDNVYPLKIRTKPNAVVLRIFVSAYLVLFIIYPPQWVNNSKSVLLLPLVWAKASAIALQKQHAIGLIASVNHNHRYLIHGNPAMNVISHMQSEFRRKWSLVEDLGFYG